MDDRAAGAERFFEIPILIAALLVIPVIVVEESSLGQSWKDAAGVVNWAIWIAFTVEFVVMLAVVPQKWEWARTHPVEVIVVALTPPFLPGPLAAARVLRLLRLIRLLRVARAARRIFSLDGLRYAALLAFMTVLGGGVAFAAVEDKPDAWDGVWWAVTTMTTVGYGDITPQTTSGRLIGIAVMFVGIGFGTLVIAAAAERFIARDIRGIAEAEEEIEATEAFVLTELRELMARMQELEAHVERLVRERS